VLELGVLLPAFRQHLGRDVGQRERKVLLEEPGDVPAAAAQLEHSPDVLCLEKFFEEGSFVRVVFGRRHQLPPAGQLGVQLRPPVTHASILPFGRARWSTETSNILLLQARRMRARLAEKASPNG
jgi:hypothetical protein